MAKGLFYGVGLASLLNCCSPNTGMIYMGSGAKGSETVYAISDRDNRIKTEIIDAKSELPKNVRDTLMSLVDGGGLPVEISKDFEGTSITIFFPIVRSRGEWLRDYLVNGYFVKKIEFYDAGGDGRLDGLSNYKRKEFRNLVRAAETVLRKYNKDSE